MQRLFVEHYLISFNATDAATKAGYSNPDKAGSRLLKNQKVAAAVEEALSKLVMTRNETLRILSSQARAEYTKYFKVATLTEVGDEDNQPGRIYLTGLIYFDFADCAADGKQYLIKEIGENQNGPYIRFTDQQTAVIWTGKHHKLFTDIVQSDRDIELDDALDALNEQAAIDL